MGQQSVHLARGAAAELAVGKAEDVAMASEQPLGGRLVAGEGQPACLIDPDAKNDGAIPINSGRRLQKGARRHLWCRQAPEDDRRNRRLQRHCHTLELTAL
jgi:hypothetical protein